MAGTPALPVLSVVVVSFNPRETLARCLDALAAQPASGDIEVVVVRGSSHAPIAAHDRRFAGGFLVLTSDATIPLMRRIGLEASRGRVVALIEDDCMVAPDWAAVLLAAHEAQSVAVGGAVEPGAYPTLLDWAAYLSDYSRYMLPFAAGPSAVLPGNNVSYKRAVVRDVLAMTEREGLQEAFVHQTLHDAGQPLTAEPRVIVRNEHRWGLRDVTAIPYFHGRAFGGRRAAGWPVVRRLLFAAGAAVLPFLHVARIANRVRARRRALPLLRALPWLWVFGVSWAAGECLGYAAGPGTSLRHWR